VLRAFKNYDSNRLILFTKILAGEITPYSNQSFTLTGAFDKFYRFDSLHIGGKKCKKVVKGELVSLSFMDISTYPFFIKRALGGSRNELKRWISAEEGVLSARVKVSIFEKVDFGIFKNSSEGQNEDCGMEMIDEAPLQKVAELKKYRQNLGISRKFRTGSQFTLLLGA
jgi:hypothetical protein